MSGLFRNDPATREGKYPVLLRRDGTVPAWEWFVLGERDPNAPAAIYFYATACENAGMDPRYVSDLRDMAASWERTQALEAKQRAEGTFTDKPADPDGPRHRTDDPDVLRFPGTLAEYRERLASASAQTGAAMLVDEIMAAAGRYSGMAQLAIRASVLSALESMAAKYPAHDQPDETAPRKGGSA